MDAGFWCAVALVLLGQHLWPQVCRPTGKPNRKQEVMHIPSQKKDDALNTLRMIIEAAENSNDLGERHLLAAANGMKLLNAMKRMLPELRRMRQEGIISVEQFTEALAAIDAADGTQQSAKEQSHGSSVRPGYAGHL